MEEDIPGTSLGGRDASTLTITALVLKLICINNYYRVNAYIRNGWDKQLVDPDYLCQSSRKVPSFLWTNGWQEITQAYSSPQQVLAFTNAQIINYFVTRTSDDGMSAVDFESMNNSTCSLYCSRHVQKIEVCQESS